jgi:YHS domain-containing protein/uncharacterized membrane protein
VNNPPDIVLFLGRFHPLMVHLPIGFVIVLALIEVISRTERFRAAGASSGLILAVAAPLSVATAVCGWLLSLGGDYDGSLLQFHMFSGFATAAGVVLAGLFYRVNRLQAYRIVLFGTLGVLMVASHFGGSLTHGRDYLTRYTPEPFRSWFKVAPSSTPAPATQEEHGPAGKPGSSLFTQVIRPVLDDKCVSCHGPDKSKGGLRLDTLEGLLKGGKDGPVLVAGKSADSEMIKRLRLPLEHDDHMPPDGKPQPSASDIALIEWWIDSGASPNATVAELKPPARIAKLLGERAKTDVVAAAEKPDIGVAPKPIDEIRAIENSLSTELKIAISELSQTEPWLVCNAGVAAASFGDAELEKLAVLGPNILWLDLAGTKVTDDGLATLSTMPNLTRLHLQRTAITDEGLVHLEKLAKLTYLNLYGTKVTDEGLKYLRNLDKLNQIYLWQTQVTPSGAQALLEAKTDKEQLQRWHDEIAQLEAKIRGAKITVDTGAVVTVIVSATTNKAPINTKCPVSDKDIDPTKTIVYEGVTIAFCCDDCKAKFEKDPKAFVAKLNLSAKSSEAAAKPINTKCPVSDKDVDPTKTVVYEGVTVAFCCDDCKAKFEKDPKAFVAKLNLPTKSPDSASKAVNTKCPVSGEDVDPTKTLVYEGVTVAFCCDDCKAKFEKDPKAFLAKLNLPTKSPDTASKAVNTKCPVSGEDVDPTKTFVYEGVTVAFCCDDCKAKFEKDPKGFAAKLNLPKQ